MYFCAHICMSPSNDYTAVACSNNHQAQLHTHISVPYWSPDICLGLQLLRDIQFGLLANFSLASYDNNHVSWNAFTWPEVGVATQKIFGHTLHASGWNPFSKFLNPPLHTVVILPEENSLLSHNPVLEERGGGGFYHLFCSCDKRFIKSLISWNKSWFSSEWMCGKIISLPLKF